MADAGRAVVTFVGDYKQLQAGLASALAPAKMGKLGALGGAAAGGALAAGIGGAVVTKALYDLGAKFDKAYDKIRVGTGKTGKQLKALENDLKSVYSRTPADLDMVAEAVVGISQRLELTGKPMRKLALNMVELSRITQTDVGENVANVTKLFGDFSVKTNDQVEALNKLYRAGQQSGVSVADLADNMKKFGSPLRALGMDFDTTAAMFAKFDAEGVNLQSAIPGLRRALKEFGEAGKEPKKALADVFAEIRKAPTDLKAMTIGFETFGTKAGPDMAMAVREGRFNLRGFIAEMRTGSDTVLKGARDTNDAGENLAVFWHKLETVLAPVGTAVYNAFSKLTRVLADMKLRQTIAEVQRFMRTNEDWKSSIGAVAWVLKALANTVKFVFQKTFPKAVDAVKTSFTGMFNVIKGVVQLIKAVVKGDFGAMWTAVKRIFKGGAQMVIGVFKGVYTPIMAVADALGDGLSEVFKAAWNRVKAIFKGGANAVIGVVNAIIRAVNAIPGVPDIGEIGKIGDGGGKIPQSALPQLRQRGGMLTGGAPSGDSIPAMLERGEYVLNRKAVQKVGVDKLDALNFKQASRFQTGGRVGMIGGGIADAVTGAAGKVFGKGADFFIDKLPKPDIPQPFTGVGPYLIEQVSDWIKGKIPKILGGGGGSWSGGSGTYPGVSGDTDFMPALGMALSKMSKAAGQSIYVNSGWRSYAEQAALYEAYQNGTGNLAAPPGSSNHESGRAADIAPGSEVFGGMASRFGLGFTVPGESWHIELLRRGGLVGKLARMLRGGRVGMKDGGWANTVGSKWDANELASLAHAVGMKAPGLMAQIALAESGGNPKLNNAGLNSDGSVDYGLWQINSIHGYNSSDMYDPVKNAKAAKDILGSQGLTAWSAYNNGSYADFPKGTVIASLSRAIRGVGGGKGSGSKPKPNKPWLDPSGGYAPGSGGPKGQIEQGQKMTEAFRKAQKAAREALARKRKRITDKIAGADRFPFRDDLLHSSGILAGLAERIGISETNAGLWNSPPYPDGDGTELTQGEIDNQKLLYMEQLTQQEKRLAIIQKAIKHMVAVRDYLTGMVAKASKKGSPLHWKLGGFRTALTGVQDILRNTLTPDLESLIGVTGGGGEIFATRSKIAELGAPAPASSVLNDNSELLSLMREQLAASQRNLAISQAQMPIFQQFMPKYHDGGVIPGRGEQPAMVMGGEGVFTRDQMAAMGGGAITVNVVVEDGAVDKNKIRAEAVSALNGIATKVRTGGPTAGRSYVTSG